jgi:hypothetical protein
MSRFETQKSFIIADRKLGKKLLGADVTMVIKGYEHLTFFVKTNGLPTLKNDEKVEYSTVHGAKNSQDGYLQLLNDIQVTFMENDALLAKNTLEKILLEDKNGDLEVDFFAGRTIEKTRHWGTLKYASVFLADAPEADSEATTTPLTISATISGQYMPSVIDEVVSLADSIANLGN